MPTPSEITEYNNKYSPKILLRMGMSYYNTEYIATRVAEHADKEIATLQKLLVQIWNCPTVRLGINPKTNTPLRKEITQALIKTGALHFEKGALVMKPEFQKFFSPNF